MLLGCKGRDRERDLTSHLTATHADTNLITNIFWYDPIVYKLLYSSIVLNTIQINFMEETAEYSTRTALNNFTAQCLS
jgi:hypothetical protein